MQKIENDTNDIFGDFLAAPIISTNNQNGEDKTTIDIKKEESNFFNQKQPDANEKMSKDSILALYNKTPQPSFPISRYCLFFKLMN